MDVPTTIRLCRRSRRMRFAPVSNRSGTAMIVAIISLMLITTICFSLVHITLAAAQQAERQEWRVQSIWLAESALGHAATRLRIDPEYTGDIWEIDDIGDNQLTGRIELRISADAADPRRVNITATADVPHDPTDRVRITRTLQLSTDQSTSSTD